MPIDQVLLFHIMLALDAPIWLKEYTSRLSLGYHQQRLLARYVTGLIASVDYMLYLKKGNDGFMKKIG